MEKRKTIESGIGYKIYYYKGLYFLETADDKHKANGFDTFEAACESAYYKGYRNSK